MNEKEVSEIRRRLRPEKNNITHVCGCYVNDQREIVSLFSQSLTMMAQEEAETYLALLKKCLSGTLGKNLIDISFATRQVADSDEHRLLMALRSTELKDRGVVEDFCRKIIEGLTFEGSYLILLAQDTYDVPFRAKDGERQDDASEEVYTYLLCTVCPVKAVKPALRYASEEHLFRSRDGGWVVAAPELGFLFPAFNQRATDLYHALYYSRDTAETHQDFVDAVFKTELPMPAAAQRETFQSLLGDTLGEECSFQVAKAVHDDLCSRIEAQKEHRDLEMLTISKAEVREVLEDCGVSDSRADRFSEEFDAAFGEGADLSPRNIVDEKQFEIKTPDVTVRVNPERSDLVETRVIGGVRYILIRADEGVEVNGVSISIEEREKAGV